MPETVIQDKYVDSIPRFNLPPEFSNEPKEAPKEPPKEAPAPVAEAKTETPPAPVAEKTETPEVKETAPPPTKGEERRIFRALQAKAQALARAEQLERELQELKQKAAPPAVAPPKMEDYTDVQEYAKAYAAHERKQAIEEYEKTKRDEANRSAQNKLMNDWNEQVSKAVLEYDDFEEVVGELKPTTPWSQAIMEAENGYKIAHYLGKNPGEARRIIALSPLSQVREIGKLEFKLAQKIEEPPRPSKAPPPIAPVTGQAAVSDDTIKPTQSFEEYRKIGNKMFRGR